MSMKLIRLYGDLGKKFGKRISLNVANSAEAIRALCVLKPGFRAYLYEHKSDPFQVIVGGEAMDEDGLRYPVGSGDTIKIVPVVRGSKDGFGSILMGIALIVVSIYAPYMSVGLWGTATVGSVIAGVGFSMVLGGVAGLLAPAPPSTDPGQQDAKTWSFGSPTLTSGQGGCVPLGYGTMRIGGSIISSGVESQTWQAGGFGGLAQTDDGVTYGNGSSIPWSWSIAP